MSVVLGVDIGTSSSQGALVGPEGELLATATRVHQIRRPHPGHVEMAADIWWAEFVDLSRELVAARPDVRVEAVGVSGMGPCTLLTDDVGSPLRPAILYGVDTRAGKQIDALNDRYTPQAIMARCGSALSSQAVGPKLAWVADNEPEVFAAARRLFMPSSWLVYRLTGEYVLDHHSASQSTPLYDTHARAWYGPWWQDLAGQVRPPPLMWPGDVAGTVSASAASETCLSDGIPVITGSVDAWAEALSVGAFRPGDLMLMYGTTMFLICTLDSTITSPTLWSTVGIYPGTRCLAAGLATSGAITEWLRDLFGSVDFGDLLEEADRSGPGAHGLLMLPYFAGERTPIYDPDARGILAGLTLSHTRGDVYRAALEATAMAVRHNLEAMTDAGARIDRVVAVGGGTRGTVWTQIVSDVTGRSQQMPTHTVGASYGSAFLAASALGTPDIDSWNPVASTVQPRSETEQDYQALYRLYRDLHRATAGIAHALADRQRDSHLADCPRQKEYPT